MRPGILAPVLVRVRCASDGLAGYVERNLGSITQNAIGQGCSARLYALSFDGHALALKQFRNQRQYAREARSLDAVQGLPVAPSVHLKDADRHIIVMDRLAETLRTHLEGARTPEALGMLLGGVLDGMAMLHERGVVHGDIHLDNVMVDGGRVLFIDFGESFLSTEFALDLLRLRHKVLAQVKEWEGLVPRDRLRNRGAFEAMERIYADAAVSRVFWIASLFNAPGVQYWVCRLLGRFTRLEPLVAEYARGGVAARTVIKL